MSSLIRCQMSSPIRCQISSIITCQMSSLIRCQMSSLIRCQMSSTHYSGGSAFCEECYAETVLPKCYGCQQPITDRALKALDAQWHVKCFVCEVIVMSHLWSPSAGSRESRVVIEDKYCSHLPSKCVPCTDASNDIGRFLFVSRKLRG